MDEGIETDIADPHAEIVRLEARIEALADKIENCRKFMLASRVAIVLGAIILAATVVGMMAFDPTIFLAAVAAVLGGFVLLGSNKTTANDTADERAEAEAERAALIGSIDLRVVGGRETLH
jgi:hypothetical protein